MKALELPKPSAPGLKVCYRCRKEKPLSDFCKNKSRAMGLIHIAKSVKKKKERNAKQKGISKSTEKRIERD